LHRNKIAHRDMKPENCLLAYANEPLSRNLVKVSDLGLASAFKKGEPMMQKCGTKAYMAPEVFSGKYSCQCDTWSCGVILYECLSEEHPFEVLGTDEDNREVRRRLNFSNGRWWDQSADCVNLVMGLLKFEVKNRIKLEKALTHTWIVKMVPKPPDLPLRPGLLRDLMAFRSLNRLKRASLNIIASLLTEKQTERLRMVFTSMDVNGDGSLSLAEIQERVAKSAKLDSEKVELQEVPENCKTPFTYTEFLAATFDRQRCVTEKACRAAFAAFDKNGDGSVSMTELCTGKLLGEVTMDEIMKIVDDIDANGDSAIDFDEFMAMMRG